MTVVLPPKAESPSRVKAAFQLKMFMGPIVGLSYLLYYVVFMLSFAILHFTIFRCPFVDYRLPS